MLHYPSDLFSVLNVPPPPPHTHTHAHTHTHTHHSCQISLFHSETQDLIISLLNWVQGSLILMTSITANCKILWLIALNFPVVYRYKDYRDCRLVDGVLKFSHLDNIIICDHTKVYQSDHSSGLLHNKKNFDSLNQPAT